MRPPSLEILATDVKQTAYPTECALIRNKAANDHAKSSASQRPHPQLRNGVLDADICVIGAGSGGLSLAAGAVQMGASVVLIAKHGMGDDRLNTGCVPSKAPLAATHAPQSPQEAGRLGAVLPEPAIDFGRVHAHVRGVIGAIAPHDSVERFEGLGVTVIQGAARLTGPAKVAAAGRQFRARRFVIATGSTAAAPPVPGLAETPFLTNETVFDLTERPGHLLVLRGGPIGIQMAQAFRGLGSEVTVVERTMILPRDEPEAVDVLRAILQRQGITITEGAQVAAIRPIPESRRVEVELADGKIIVGSHLLVAAGRKPNMDGLDLSAAGVETTSRGITVDARLRTRKRRVFASGDVAGGPQFTHVAGYHAGTRGPTRARSISLPRAMVSSSTSRARCFRARSARR